jgi:hypothetical protein
MKNAFSPCLRRLIWLIVPMLVIWALRRAPIGDILAILVSLDPWQLGGLIAFNALALGIFPGRWWLILRAQGESISYWQALRYRMAAFTVSYFTPGSQFGGEPVQVYALHARHKLPLDAAVASVALDKLFELLANFTFLGVGAALALSRQGSASFSIAPVALPMAGLLALPAVYLALLWSGHQPAGRLLNWSMQRMPGKLKNHPAILTGLGIVSASEGQISDVLRKKPALMLQIAVSSALIWSFSLAEYWLALRVLGVHLNLGQTILALSAARLAFLTPLPGGVGALEASQVIAMQALGINPVFGVAVSLWIRARDLALGALGAAFGAALSREALQTSGAAQAAFPIKP